ncbi:MAG: tRNA lysidine(34) synthetase TilS [Alphaproteobacteria bacterium]|nr:MAG: tRNA lysidine(34) synthetase TilS [Alphaproteobacteria bacterium]TAF14533.1 MAG: tRNA lysidine(34) synthetase TilS [Alphaproteobacteria bacterium]TAF38513.1 MAG: tRNA lysidine(34) synthetase TilS [Alphaproteobacteria bacterium]TAF74912.1 MAG: tRNA lysidine(34) synthetase TilS [Alphaproteobacteria bacterium]
MPMLNLMLPYSSEPLAVATSGGSDSMALVCALKEREPERTIIALHVDHRLRSSSTKEAHQLQKWLEVRSIPCIILTIDPPLDREAGNLAAQARSARYALMEGWCMHHDVHVLATAHHLGDQAETFLMRLARGSGVDGLSCIAQERMQPSGIKLVRPILHWHKEDAISFLQQRGIPWIEDPTNHLSCYQRNRWRMMMPQLAAEGLSIARLARHAHHMARLADFMYQHTAAWLQQHKVFAPQAYALLPYDAWCEAHEELALRLLRACLMHIQPHKTPRFDALEQLYHALHNAAPKPQTVHGCMIRTRRNQIFMYREMAHCSPHITLSHIPQLWDNRVMVACAAPSPVQCGALGVHGLAWLRRHVPDIIPDLPATLLHSLPTFFHLEEPIAIPHIDYYAHTCEKRNVMCLMHNSVGIDAEF